MSEQRYRVGDTVGGEELGRRIVSKSEQTIANAAYAAGREEALRELGPVVEAAKEVVRTGHVVNADDNF